MMTYLWIFIFKIVEEALRTLRIIVVSNGKKIMGAILQFFIALIWIIVTGSVISNIEDDPYKIIIYSLGSLIGSYFGSYIEEKIALGYIILITELNEEKIGPLNSALKKAKYTTNIVKGNKKGHVLLMVTSPRKKQKDVTKIIRKFDKNAEIITEKVKIISHRL